MPCRRMSHKVFGSWALIRKQWDGSSVHGAVGSHRGPASRPARPFPGPRMGERMTEGLELESRRRIYEFLLANPGVHLRRIGQNLGMSTGMLSYHLGILERRGLLKSEELGHRKRYFIARAFADGQPRIL